MLGHLLVAQKKDASQAREVLVAAGLHGKITVGQWTSGTLPFIDNFVNLLIVDSGSTVSREEIERVLAPEGIALIGTEKTVKPRPATMDDWTHQLHDATGNAVSTDKMLRPPLAHIQWIATSAPRCMDSRRWLLLMHRKKHCSPRPTSGD